MGGRRNIFNQVFNLAPGEKSTVTDLFFHHFFQGFGISLIFIVSNALFLSHYSYKELPLVYILSGFLVLFAGRIYAWFEHHIKVETFLISVVLATVLTIILLWGTGLLVKASLFAFLLLASYQVIYLLYNLEFWGLSALVFDVRQSKRLFGLISAGDIPAKMIGYLLVSGIAPFISLNHLLLLSAVSVVLSLFFLKRILNQHDLHAAREKNLHHHYKSGKFSVRPIEYLKGFFRNRFILQAAVLSLIVVITLAVINFSFLAEVKYKFKSDKELASFFGLFFALGQFITIFIKAFLSGRFIKWLGIRRGLLVLPISIIITLLVSFPLYYAGGGLKDLIYVYGFLMLFTEIFKYALQQPLFLSLFQPLNTHLRLHGHTVIKGFVDGLGMIAGGVFLLFLLKAGTDMRLVNFGIVILVLAIAWVLWVLVVDRGYVKLLNDAIRIRRLTGAELQIDDERVQESIMSKITTGKPWEIIYGLNILKNNNDKLYCQAIALCLDHPLEQVRNWALSHSNADQIQDRMDHFKDRLFDDPEGLTYNQGLLNRLLEVDINAYTWAAELLGHEDRSLVSSVIRGLLKGRSIEGMVIAGNRLIEMKNSSRTDEKIQLCHIIRDLQLNNFDHVIAKYLDEENEELIREAIQTAGSLKSSLLFPKIMTFLVKYAGQSWYLQTLAQYDKQVIEYFTTNLSNYAGDKKQMDSIVFIARIVESPSVYTLLLDELFLQDSELRSGSLDALSEKSVDLIPASTEAISRQWIDLEIDHLSGLIRRIQSPSGSGKMKSLFGMEFNHGSKRVFNWLYLAYQNDSILGAREAYFSHFSNMRANSVEMLEGILNQRESARIIPVLEQKSAALDDRIKTGENSTFILSGGHRYFSDWSIAFAISELPVNHFISRKKELSAWLKDPVKIIRQQAEKKHQEINLDMNNELIASSELLEIEKVGILKGTDLFSETPESLLADLAGFSKTESYGAGDIIFREGDPGDKMYIVYAGEINIFTGERTLASFVELDFFGELSLLDNEARSATAQAVTDSLLLSISQEDFYELISFRPEVAKSVLRTLSKRLRRQNKS